MTPALSRPVVLAAPIVRGDTTIAEVAVRKPNAGALRGTKLVLVGAMSHISNAIVRHDVGRSLPRRNGGVGGVKETSVDEIQTGWQARDRTLEFGVVTGIRWASGRGEEREP